MNRATVRTQGRLTLPAKVRQALQVGAGDQVEFVELAPSRFEVIAVTRSVGELKGMFGKPTKTISIDDMNLAIAARGTGP